MTSSDADGEDRSLLWPLAVGLAVVLLGSSLFARSTAVLDPTVAVGGTAVFAGIAFALLWRRSATSSGGSDGADGEGDEDSSVWNAIPSWQYEGRHVESGGLTRSEQEQALQDIQQQAEELSDEPERP